LAWPSGALLYMTAWATRQYIDYKLFKQVVY